MANRYLRAVLLDSTPQVGLITYTYGSNELYGEYTQSETGTVKVWDGSVWQNLKSFDKTT